MPSAVARAALVTAVVLGLGSVACGADDKTTSSAATVSVKECQQQWDDVAANLVGLDADLRPSALRKRWANVLGTVSLYQGTTTADRCQENIENLSTGITELRQFSARLQPFDMEYQADAAAEDVQRYLAEPLPAPVRKDRKLVKPPTKEAVTAAVATLTEKAAEANADLAPAWAQFNDVELTDEAAVSSALADLSLLAKDSASWRACQQALKVVKAALAAQRVVDGGSTPTPTATPSSSSTPSTTP